MIDDSSFDPEEDFRIQRRNLIAVSILVIIFTSHAISIEHVSTGLADFKIHSPLYWRGFFLVSLLYLSLRYIYAVFNTHAIVTLNNHIQKVLAKAIPADAGTVYIKKRDDQNPVYSAELKGAERVITLFLSTRKNIRVLWEIYEEHEGRAIKKKLEKLPIDIMPMQEQAPYYARILYRVLGFHSLLYVAPIFLSVAAISELLSFDIFNDAIHNLGIVMQRYLPMSF